MLFNTIGPSTKAPRSVKAANRLAERILRKAKINTKTTDGIGDKHILSGFILHAAWAEKNATLVTVRDLVINPNQSLLKTLNRMMFHEHDGDLRQRWATSDGKTTKNHPYIARISKFLIDMPEDGRGRALRNINIALFHVVGETNARLLPTAPEIPWAVKSISRLCDTIPCEVNPQNEDPEEDADPMTYLRGIR
jgi:hypothetical protein